MKEGKYVEVSILHTIISQIIFPWYKVEKLVKNVCRIKKTQIDKSPGIFQKFRAKILGNNIKFLELLKFLNSWIS